MLKKSLIFCICLCLCSSAFAQMIPAFSLGSDQKEMLKKLQKENPRLAEFQKRLSSLYEKIQIIVNDYQKGYLSKEKAEEKLRPLLREQLEISNNLDYLVEMNLFGLFFQPDIE